jgi:hypothetical protein
MGQSSRNTSPVEGLRFGTPGRGLRRADPVPGQLLEDSGARPGRIRPASSRHGSPIDLIEGLRSDLTRPRALGMLKKLHGAEKTAHSFPLLSRRPARCYCADCPSCSSCCAGRPPHRWARNRCVPGPDPLPSTDSRLPAGEPPWRRPASGRAPSHHIPPGDTGSNPSFRMAILASPRKPTSVPRRCPTAPTCRSSGHPEASRFEPSSPSAVDDSPSSPGPR